MKEHQAPIAKKIPHVHEAHGHQRIDNYHWMTQRDAPEVINYLNQENDYYEKMTAHTKQLKVDLFEEIKSRINEDDESVPYFWNGYWYYTKMKKGESYPFYYRKKESLSNKEELLFNVNEMAIGHEFFQLTGMSVSPDNTMVSYGVDTVGRRQYTIYIKDLQTHKVMPQALELTTGGAVWDANNNTLFFVRKDEQTLRANQIFKYKLGAHPDTATIVYQEDDEIYNCYVYKSKSREYIMIKSSSTLTDEVRFIKANQPDSEFKVVQPRTDQIEYSVLHYGDHFYIMTNKDDATNFKIMKTEVTKPEMENWVDVIPHQSDVLLEDFEIFKKYLVISDRFNGLNRIRIKSWDDTVDYFLPFDNETYTAFTGGNYDFDTVKLRYQYNSLTTPPSVIEFDMDSREEEVLKIQKVQDPKFTPDDYTSERVWATAADGVKVPISLVYKKSLKRSSGNPLLLYGYGSYGSTIDPYFSISRLSLLDRGFIYAIAHIRGSEYLGRPWYEDGKMFAKRNTFTDFIACSEHLINNNFTSPSHLYASGGSAGGLLMGAIMNMAPQLYNGILSAVPFVDVVTTMLDDSIPLTTGEYDEWGNPNHKDSYEYMLSYSPYDQVAKHDYPNVLITTGYHDSQVQYWEPAKWVARLRELKTDNNLLLFKTDMTSGHSGASGRYDALKEVAIDYAFLLDLEQIES
ncbi:S9 family peptidase [Nonlabens ulvanivorans]|uniref:Proline-specific endopeptidase n=1 Tax=Nonlabens ulvanivorans TaxID=906888 RepID=A0A084K074_NONUL|nr:oligopeptidase B [Nonlabens ulvanivorans]KEZ94608.1 protease 2 [Nonlabens ulvanivorans]PRX12520.1 oligopeptidase B [Nonlabens ulvanivorans]